MALTTNRQIRAARALLGWEQDHLAAAAKVSTVTIRRMEKTEGTLPGRHETVQKLQRAFEEAGVEFINSDKPGVRLDMSKVQAPSAAA